MTSTHTLKVWGALISIHTPTKGVTQFCLIETVYHNYFNPHSHEGSDDAEEKVGQQLENISIHTPTKGVTTSSNLAACFTQISIHTPTKGVTKDIKAIDATDIHFNPHSHEGSDDIL